MQAFRLRAAELGVQFQERMRVVSLQRHACWTVGTTNGSFESDALINCSGAWGWEVAGIVGEQLPQGYFAPSVMVTTRMAHFLDPVILGTGRQLSFKQTESGTVVIGGGILCAAHL
jgi:sarcosine oxidase, subunit beta